MFTEAIQPDTMAIDLSSFEKIKGSEMHQKFSVKEILASRLGKYVLTWVLIISIFPVLIISLIDYQISSKSIKTEVKYYLKETSNLISQRITNFFSERKTDLQILAESKTNTKIVEKFLAAHKASNINLKEFVKTEQWQKIVNEDCKDLKNFNNRRGYYDLFLIDLSGNIIYSVVEEEDLGTNLLTGKFSDTKFAKAVNQCIKKEEMTFSDFEFYAPSNNAAAGFIVNILKDNSGRGKGIIALQFDQKEINKIVNFKSKNFSSFDSYLVGSDLVMRSSSLHNSVSTMLKEVVKTELTENWKNKFVDNARNNPLVDITKEYIGRKGTTVLGINKNMDIAGISFGIIIEVDKNEVFAPLEEMKWIVIVGILFFTIIVFVLSVSFTKKIVYPITLITDWGKKLALGEVISQKIDAPNNEIGKLVEIFEQIADSSTKIALQADNIAKGEFQFVVKPRSENDILGNSLKAMTESLQKISEAVESVANGNLEIKIDEKSTKDLLGRSINKMTANLKETIENSKQLISNLNSLPTPVYTIDRDFNLTYVNPKGAELAGEKPEELYNKKCYEVFKNHDCKSGKCSAAIAMNKNMVHSKESVLELKNKSVPINYSASPILNYKKEIDGAIVYVMDITESKKLLEDNQLQLWFSKGLSEISKIVREIEEVSIICNKVCSFLAQYLDCHILALYIAEDGESENKKMKLTGSYALERIIENKIITPGEGIVGQAAIEKQIIKLNNLPQESTRVNSSIVSVKPKNIIAVPLMSGENVIGVLELGSIHNFDENKVKFLRKMIYLLGISLNTIISNIKVQSLLKKTEQQQQELKISNEELEERTRQLDEQNKSIEEKNRSLVTASEELRRNAEKLEITSKYKSEFLANMSHELRTPLNSLLLLAQNLSKNKEGNLTEKQVKNAKIIYNGGTDLLNMINEILDSSKIESGKMDVISENIGIQKFKNDIMDLFIHLAEKKELKFSVNVNKNVPAVIKSDRQKLFQIIKNLVSNALKFTHTGGIEVNIYKLSADVKPPVPDMIQETTLAIAVSDTGIGIPENKQLEVFEAFQQADGSTSRKYGGTGLGLSISREMAKLLGGEIILESKQEKGSTFTLYINDNLPDKINDNSTRFVPVQEPLQPEIENKNVSQEHPIGDNPDSIQSRDIVIVGIEDDLKFADILSGLCRENSCKFIHATSGHKGLELVKKIKPAGIFLDVNLPGLNGYKVLEKIKADSLLRYIPIFIISVHEKPSDIFQKGITGFLSKPVEINDLEQAIIKIKSKQINNVRKVLLVEKGEKIITAAKVLEDAGLKVKVSFSGRTGLEFIENEEFDAVVFNWELNDVSGEDFLKTVKKINTFLPVIVFSDHELEESGKELVNALASEFVTGNDYKNLLQILSFFIKPEISASDQMPDSASENNGTLKSKTVLLVDDDIRNLYSLEEEFLELEMNVIKATDGKMCIEKLKSNKEVDIVLMDIMMPIMNGYEAMQAIRNTEGIKEIPIIAVTAKAMKEDRDKCINSGANDYIAKPVDIEALIKLMKNWIKN